MPHFSIIIPLFNKERYIRAAIDSILAQTCQHFELIIIDDGSTDNSTGIVQDYRSPHIVLHRQQNRGVSVARNVGIEMARHDFIAFLDADDTWKPHFLDTITRLINNFPEAGLYATSYDVITPNGNITRPTIRGILPPPWEGILENYFLSALDSPPVWTSACVARKNILVDNGGFDAAIHMGEDLDLWARIALRHPVAYSSTIGASWHRDVIGSLTKLNIMDDFLPFIHIAKKATAQGLIHADQIYGLNKYIQKMELTAIKHNLLSGNIDKAKTLLKQSSLEVYSPRRIMWRFWCVMPFIITKACYRVFKGAKRLIKNYAL